MISPEAIAAFSADDPIQKSYDAAIQKSQDGQFDNLPKRARFYVRHQIARHAISQFPALDIAECGCWLGQSTVMTADLARDVGFSGRFSVFDSFEGLSDFTDEDIGDRKLDADQIARQKAHFRSNEDHVAEITSSFGFVDLYRGWIPERFDEVADRQFSFVHIDVDLYSPTKASIDFFYQRLCDGGAIFFDDYGYNDFPGTKAAVDEFLASKPGHTLFIVNPVGSAYLIK